MHKSTDAIEQLYKLIQSGIRAWIDAGELLVELLEEDEKVFGKITSRYPEITPEILACLEKVGRHEIHPKLLLSSGYGAKKLAELPYDKQCELVDKRVLVEVSKQPSGRPKRASIPVVNLTPSQYHQVYGGKPKSTKSKACNDSMVSNQYYWEAMNLRDEVEKLKERLKKEEEILRSQAPPYYIEDQRCAFLRPCVLTRDQLHDIVDTMDANKLDVAA